MHHPAINTSVAEHAVAAATTPFPEQAVRLAALGGLGEIGMNCLLLEQHHNGQLDRLIIDCGAIFRDGEWGVDAYGPRLDDLLDAPDALRGVALTHGHEDHVGALWTLALHLGPRRSTPIEVVGPPYAIAWCRRRLEEYPALQRHLSLRVNALGERFRLGSFELESVRMTHSTPDASLLAIQTVAGRVVHSGDFKFDPTPRHGLPSDTTRLQQLGDEGVRLLLADSTNALADGHTRSEALPAATLLRLVGEAPERVVIGLFASNVERLDAAAAAARAHGRRLCLLGRSLHSHVEVSQQLGRLDWPSDLLLRPQQARELPRQRVLYLATGTQGEPRAALRRLAARRHHQLQLEPGDTVLMSSRIIPGMERAVVALINDLERQGVNVIGRLEEPDIHVSGHARRDELRQLLAWLRPRSFVPLHGTSAHLRAHAQLARAAQVPQVHEMRNGDRALLERHQLHATAGCVAGLAAYRSGRALAAEPLRERRQVGQHGVLFAAVDATTPARVSLRALGLDLDETTLQQLQRYAVTECERLTADDVTQPLRLALRRRLAEMLGYKPLVEVISIDDGGA